MNIIKLESNNLEIDKYLYFW